MKISKALLIILFSTIATAQHLTISDSGQTGTSGTNWSITGNTLNVAASGTANVHPSVITNHLTNTGDLTVNLPWQSNVARQCIINGSITYTALATRTLTFNIANDILMESANNSISATNGALNVVIRTTTGPTSSTPDHGRISIGNNNSINTNGGHLWMGGGNVTTTWNNLAVGNSFARTWDDDIPGLGMNNSTLNTNGGNIYLAGLSHDTSDANGSNNGVLIDKSSISSASGNIEIKGYLTGRYTSGHGTAIFSSTGTTAITTTTGSINIKGDGFDQANNGNDWRIGMLLNSTSVTNSLKISTTSGNILLEGNANFAATINDKEGLVIFGSGLGIVSQTGNINIKGSNTLETSGQFSNSIRFAPANVTNAIRIGFDGTNAYSGNIIIEGNSIYQRDNWPGAGSIALQTTGTLTIQPTGNAFTFMRAGNTGTLTYDDDWNFGTNLGGLTLGKATNTQNITFGSAVSIAGPITAYGGSIAVTAAITAAGDILLDGDTGNFLTQNTKGVTSTAAITTSNNGNITILGRGGSGTTYSANHGIDIKNKVEAGGTGNINIVGYGGLSSNGTSSSCHGVNLDVSNAWVKSNGGNITINGFGGGASAGSYSMGIPMQNSSKVSAAGAGTVTITGTGGVNTVAGLRGVVITSSSSVYSAGGAITITGINGTNGLDYSDGVYFDNAIIGSNASGPITISGRAGTGISNALLMNTTNTIGGASHANNIILRGNNMSLSGTNSVLTTGQVTIEPSSDSFASAITFPITNLSIANTITGLTLGKPTNTSNLTFATATTIAGPITAYGGTITANANLTTTSVSNAPILLQGSKVIHNQGVSVQTNGSNITYNVTNSPWTTAEDHGILLGTVIGTTATATINAQGGNVSLASSFASTGVTSSNPDVAILMKNSLIKTSASGTITLNGNAYDNASNNVNYTWGIMFLSNEVIQTEHGAISITGTGGKTNGNARGIIADNTALKVLSVSGPITFTEVMPNGHSVANHTGTYFKPAATNAIKIGADGTLVTNSTSNVVFDVARITFDGTIAPTVVNTSGTVTIQPVGNQFDNAVSLAGLSLSNTATGFTIGKLTNTANVTFATATTIAGPITAYGANINVNSNLKTTNSGAMYLKGNITIAAGNHIESNGDFTHDGNMTFKSTATGTAAFGPLGGTFTTVSGTSTVERYIPAKRAFRFLSPSVTTSTSIRQNWQENGVNTAGLGTHITGTGGSTNGFDTTGLNNPSMFTSTDGTWEPVTSTLGVLTAGTPYRLMVRGDRTISLATNSPTATVTTLRATGVLKTGPHSPTLNQATAGFSFVGNPYQAPVNIKEVLATSTNMNTGFVYYWDPTLNDRGAYVTRTLSSVSTNAPSSDFTEILQPGQAVFVKKAATASAASMLFTESNKSVTNSAAGVFRTTTTEFGTLRTNLRASIDNQWRTIEGTLAVFNPMYSWEVTQEDANKFSNLDEEVSFMQNNTSLAIACQPNPSPTNELPIRLNTTRHANYQWQFELGNYSGPTPYLFDTQNNTYTQIDNNTIVPFAVNGQELTRFKIVFQSGTLSTPDFSNQIVLYPNPGASGASSFNIEGITDAQVSLFTLLGQNISVRTATNGKGMEVISKTSLSKGVYLVNITKEGKTSHVKWIVE